MTALKKLKCLYIQDNNFDDNGVFNFREFENLHKINISQTRITGNGIDYFPLENLEIMQANFINLGNNGIQKLTHAPKLRHLNVKGANFDDTALPYFEKMKNLEILDISYNKISSQKLLSFSDRMQNVRIISEYMK